jgi:ADP-heptose:LPS heptosyltransferase
MCLLVDVFLVRRQTHKLISKPVILVMRLDAIGDFVIWSACANAYRQLYPKEKYHLVLLGHIAWKEVANELKFFDEILAMDRKQFMLSPGYRLKVWKDIDRYKFETIIYHTYSREFASGDLIVRKLLAKEKIGIKSDNAIDTYFWSGISNNWYNELKSPEFTSNHELIKNATFIQSLGLKDFKPTIQVINIKNCPCDEIDTPEKYFILFPGARVGLRKWNEENYAAISQKLYQSTGWQGIICGGKDERELGKKIIQLSGLNMINLCGETSLLQLIGIIKKAKILIGNETSGIHIAASVQTPSICILGGGHFGRFVPYPDEINSNFKPIHVYEQMPCFNCDWNCIYQIGKETTVPCIKNITVDRVWCETERLVMRLETSG